MDTLSPFQKSPVAVAAELLRNAYNFQRPCAPVRDLLPAGDVEAAYDVQETNTQLWIAEGRRLVGRKIGLTSVAVQKQLGVDQPDFGMLFADMAAGDGEPIPVGAVLQPKVEAEIAFVIDRDLRLEQPTVEELVRSIACAVVAIEVVGSRIANWDIRLVDTIADNASSGMFVLGKTPFALKGLDLRDCTMQMSRGGEVVSTGVGHACLGHPLDAALWLARKMLEVVDHCMRATSSYPAPSAPWFLQVPAMFSRRAYRAWVSCERLFLLPTKRRFVRVCVDEVTYSWKDPSKQKAISILDIGAMTAIGTENTLGVDDLPNPRPVRRKFTFSGGSSDLFALLRQR